MESVRAGRSLVIVAASIALIASACGSDDGTAGDRLPAPAGAGADAAFVIDIVEGHPLWAVIEAEQQGIESPRDDSFDVAASLEVRTTTGDVFRLAGSVPYEPDEVNQRVADLASAFDVDGPVQLLGVDDVGFGGAGRRVGDAATGFVEVNGPAWNDGGQFFFTGSSEQLAGLTPCATLPDGPCETEQATGPPESTARAEQQIAAAIAAIGVEPDAFVLDADSLGNSVQFTAVFAPGGRRTGVTWGFSVGTAGDVASAYGPFAAPSAVAEVPLIDLDKAIDRLHLLYGAFDVATTTSTAVPGQALPTPPPKVGDEMPPMPAVEIDLRSRTIVEVSQTLTLLDDSPSGPWLLPTFTFVADDGGTYDVIAVAASEFVVSSLPNTQPPPTTVDLGATPPPTIPQPRPTLLADDGTPVTLPVPPSGPGFEPGSHAELLRRILVGRPLGEVVSTLEATGWMVQLIDEAEPNATVTPDIQPTRARVFHRDDIVTDVQVDPWPDSGGAPIPATTTVITLAAPDAPSIPPAGTIALDNPVVTLPGADEVSRSTEGERTSYEVRIEDLLLGVGVDRAIAELEAVGWIVRIVSEDGVGNDVTMDERGDRANLSIERGVVVGMRLF